MLRWEARKGTRKFGNKKYKNQALRNFIDRKSSDCDGNSRIFLSKIR